MAVRSWLVLESILGRPHPFPCRPILWFMARLGFESILSRLSAHERVPLLVGL